MAIGEKYAPLGNWLKEHGGDSVKLTFDELNQIIPIPNHAYKNRPSWANLSSPASFCSSWISAGYVVDSISLEEQWVVFRKGEVQGHTHHSTVGCVPAYDRYFKKALADTGAAPQVFSAKSIRTLGNLYLDHEDEFEKLRKHCGSRIEYPAAKILDMCFFEYGFQRDASSQEGSE